MKICTMTNEQSEHDGEDNVKNKIKPASKTNICAVVDGKVGKIQY